MPVFPLIDWVALLVFIISWGGYTAFANKQQAGKVNLSRSLSQLRGHWMKAMVGREIRIPDTHLLSSLQRNVTFFASTTIFILAGLLAVLGASEKAIKLANALPFVAEHSRAAWELKILLMVFVFIYAFFKFSWSVRQYNFALVLFGAAPEDQSQDNSEFIRCANGLLTSANNSFSYGLRAYTLSMAIIAWFVHPLLFILCSAWVVGILYRREFKSRTLAAMIAANKSLES